MPELPEVETIKLQLEKEIEGKEIKDVRVNEPRLINLSVSRFQKVLVGLKIEKIGRRAKILIFELSKEYQLFIHLKLTGQLFFQSTMNDHLLREPQIVFTFIDNSRLFYNDLRRFGWLKLFKREQGEKFLIEEKFGPEPLEKEFTQEVFKNLLENRSRMRIKPCLMDQRFIAGIGNVYAAEICFFAKIRPTRLIKTLTEREKKDLYFGIKKILFGAVKQKGSSVGAYLDIYVEKGEYIQFLKVYQRAGKKCFRCQTKIKEIRLAGRSTCFCPKCQI